METSYITQAEVARKLGVNQSAVLKLINNGKLPYIVAGKKKLIPRSAYDHFLQNRRLPGWAGYWQKQKQAKQEGER